jgi:D-glycero-alpha-D-manno-heptose-7-phosphate kinase
MTSYLLRAKAPLRVSFAGGGTDVPPFPEHEGGLVLNATISRYAHGTLAPRTDRQIRIESIDFDTALEYGVEDPVVYDGSLDLVKAAVGRIGSPDAGGFDLFLQSNAPPGSGLGSSSAMMVALIGLLKDFHRLPLTDYEVAHLAYTIERKELGLKGGLQDQYAATFGGFNFIEFLGDRVIVNPLRIKADVMNELEHNLLLCYTGVSRPSDGIIDDQTQRLQVENTSTLEGLREQKTLAVDMKNALLQGRLSTFAELLGQAWVSKKKMSPKITSPLIEEAYEEATKSGAISGKVTGAGGGGYLLFYCDYRRKHKVAEALTRLGTTLEEFSFVLDGLGTWRVDGA